MDNEAIGRQPLSVSNFNVPKVYAPLFKNADGSPTTKKKFILASGRASGKSSILVILWYVTYCNYPDSDILVLQSTNVEIKDSIIVEIIKFLKNSGFDVGDDPNCEWYVPKAHNLVQRRGCKGATRFFPITDSKGGQRSRGINTENAISLVMYEEAQKNATRDVVEQSLITFVRQIAPYGKIVIVGNNETIGHWFVDFVEEKMVSGEWEYIYACCYDIWTLLNNETQKYIEDLKEANPIEFKRVFLGDIYANTSDVVFPMFNAKTMYLLRDKIPVQRIRYVFYGIDHATANDTFAIVPVAILEDGTAQTLEVCFDDPQETNRTLAPSEQADIAERFFKFMDDRYGFAFNQTPCIASIDGAASPFIAQLLMRKRTSKERRMWKNIDIKKFTYKGKERNLNVIRNAFAFKVLIIMNEGYRCWDGSLNTHRLKHEIEAQRYKNYKLDASIKNDLCDALEYGLIPFYSNCYNLSFPERYEDEKKSHYKEIRALANMK